MDYISIKNKVKRQAERVKVLAAEPDNRSLIPGTYMVEGENCVPQASVYTHTHTPIKQKKAFFFKNKCKG